MLKIRLTRKGKKNKAFFRLVVAEHTSPIKGKFIEVLGFLNPHTKEKSIKADRVKHWLASGARCSDTAHNLLVSEGILNESKRAVKIKKKEEEKKEEVVPAAGEKPADEKKEEAVPASGEKPVEEKKESKEPSREEVKEEKKVEK
jgi:small subunit ribosomal protein S16